MQRAAPAPGEGINRHSVVLAFAATILLSALLLFSVQPMVAKMVLPVLGGAPATWAVSLCFFQGLLLLGYGYAHLLGTRLGSRQALALHLGLFLAAFIVLPVGLKSGLEPPEHHISFWLLGELAVLVGLPFFVLSASAPLLQAWFGRIGHHRSSDPYFLYAASNAGSLVALLAYPVLLEPLLPLPSQSRLWTWGYSALLLAVAGCGLLLVQQEPARNTVHVTDAGGTSPLSTVSWRKRAAWIFLSFIPSGLLVAYTTYLTTDLASAPLLWVLPLALYLGTFIVVFRQRSFISARVLFLLQPALVGATIAANEWKGDYSWAVSALLGLLAFVVTSLACHSELYRQRPDTTHLTSYYLHLSLGGVLGGAFAALLAPVVFTGTWEFPLLLVLGLLCRPALWCVSESWRKRIELALMAGAAAVTAWLTSRLVANGVIAPYGDLRLHAVMVLAAAAVVLTPWPRLVTALIAGMLVAAALLPSPSAPVFVTRSFFGTHRIVDTAGGGYRLLLHGTTVHGIQQNRSGVDLVSRMMPLAYYHPSGPLAKALGLVRAAAAGGPVRIGVVGLGTGAMSCYAEPGDRWRFFEIDPEVVHIATRPSLFRYIARCLPDADIVVGDARLRLAKEPDGSFDFLMIDAFSSDAIPIHLLTVEAIELYLQKLSERGVLALHISNQNFDLPPVLESNVAALPHVTGVYVEGQKGGGALASQVVLVSRHAGVLAPALTWHRARRLEHASVRRWTDDYSDVLSAVWRRYKSKLQASLDEK